MKSLEICFRWKRGVLELGVLKVVRSALIEVDKLAMVKRILEG